LGILIRPRFHTVWVTTSPQPTEDSPSHLPQKPDSKPGRSLQHRSGLILLGVSKAPDKDTGCRQAEHVHREPYSRARIMVKGGIGRRLLYRQPDKGNEV